MSNIEKLKKEVNNIKNSLNELKNNVSLSEVEKKKKTETLKAQADTTKQKIENEIKSLKDATDTESIKNKNKAETLLRSLTEITDLYNSIIKSGPNTNQNTSQETSDNRNIFVKSKDWIGKQWNDLKTRNKREEEPGKSILRFLGFGAGIGLAGYGIYKGVKKLWNGTFGKKKKGKDGENDKTETKPKGKEKKQSFRKANWKNFLKWAGITTATGGGIYAISKLFSSKKENVEIIQEGGDTISDAMFQNLLHMEGDQGFVAKSHKKRFGENFVTGPYGMVYKHIDENGNLLEDTVSFKEGERVSKDWAQKNARAYYNKRAKEWADLLRSKGYKYNQDMLDALVSASGGTKKSVDRLKNFVLSHWYDKKAISDFMSKFATTAAGNGKTMAGLVIRRDFEANWFKGNKEPMSEYQRRYYA